MSGVLLNDAYCDEVGVERAEGGQPAVTQTPIDFRSEWVTITAVELGEMRSGSQGEKMGDRPPLSEHKIEIDYSV